MPDHSNVPFNELINATKLFIGCRGTAKQDGCAAYRSSAWSPSVIVWVKLLEASVLLSNEGDVVHVDVGSPSDRVHT